MFNRTHYMAAPILGVLLLGGTVAARQSSQSSALSFDLQQQMIRYDLAFSADNDALLVQSESKAGEPVFISEPIGRKSPFKAFVLSLAVPGLGQYYYGSRVKPFLFIGVEAAAWILNRNFDSKGDDITAEFEQFNRDHWSQDRYEEYLFFAYGTRDDDSVTETEASHHLPDSPTQQYYEMTGKYDQFSWGWDDAKLGDTVWSDTANGWRPDPVKTPETTPYTARRLAYEDRRHDADIQYDHATKMFFVSMVNHLTSAFEALLTTRRINKQMSSGDPSFSSVRVNARLRSISSPGDTPYVQFSYKF